MIIYVCVYVSMIVNVSLRFTDKDCGNQLDVPSFGQVSPLISAAETSRFSFSASAASAASVAMAARPCGIPQSTAWSCEHEDGEDGSKPDWYLQTFQKFGEMSIPLAVKPMTFHQFGSKSRQGSRLLVTLAPIFTIGNAMLGRSI